MRRSVPPILFGLFAILGFIPVFASVADAKTAAQTPLEISAWIPYWRTATGTADAMHHLDSLTEINPFGYIVQPDGSLYDPMHIDQAPWSTLIAAAKAKHVRVIPTVMWSDTNAIHNILSNASSRVALEETIANLAKTEGFDGIDIDFEGKRAEDKNHFSTFLKGLYARMGNKWVMCDIEARTPVVDRYNGTPPSDATDYANDDVAINKYCDRVNLMTYDQGSIDAKLDSMQTGPYIPVADPQWVDQVINLAVQSGISRKKIRIGVATYGYEYQLTPLTQGYRYTLQWAFDPNYATKLAATLNITPTRNAAGELSFMYLPSTVPPTVDETTPANELPNPTTETTSDPAAVAAGIPMNIVWWSDAQAVGQKVQLAKDLGVRGISLFKLDGGEDQGLWNYLPHAGDGLAGR